MWEGAEAGSVGYVTGTICWSKTFCKMKIVVPYSLNGRTGSGWVRLGREWK